MGEKAGLQRDAVRFKLSTRSKCGGLGKDDRLDAQTLARLPRIDPEFALSGEASQRASEKPRLLNNSPPNRSFSTAC
jgi:hypothetical protein